MPAPTGQARLGIDLGGTKIAGIVLDTRGATLAEAAEVVDGVHVVARRLDGAGGGDVRTLALDVRGRLPQGAPGVVVMLGAADGKVSVVAATNDEARALGLSANDLVRLVGPLVGGKGGGKADVAQGGGSDVSRLDEAVALVPGAVHDTVSTAGQPG